MNTKRICLKCGAALAEDAPEGICPRCLLEAAAGMTHSEEAEASKTTTFLPEGSERGAPARAAGKTTTLPALRYFGDYELLEEIARGGMGIVYKARQTRLNRSVAVKMILAGELATGEAVRRFRAEAEAAANLQHPNIVAIHEVGEQEGQQYFSMDYVEGKNLSQVLSGKPFAPRQAAELVETIAKAIHYGHQRGTLHRDLKPQKVLIDASGQPRITDFGLAKRLDEDQTLTQPGTVMGSPSYMPPEQATGRQDQIGPQSDVYSLGAILYEVLTGQPPFRAETAMATMIKVRDEQPVKPTRVNTEIPRDLETICLKCLEKQPERRYASARALAEDLRRFLDHEPILARPSGFARHAEFWARRHPWTLIGAATFALMLLLALSYYLWQENSYLRWVNTHPGYVRMRGVRTAEVEKLKEFLVPVYLAVVICSLGYRRRSRRLSWSQLFGGESKHAVIHAIPLGWRQIIYSVAAVGGLFSLYVLVKAIDQSVWEDPLNGFGLYFSSDLYFTATVCAFAGALAWGAYREQHAIALGERPGAIEIKPTSASRRTVAAKILAAGAGGFFLFYFMNLWLPVAHVRSQELGIEFLAGFVSGAALAISWTTTGWRRFLIFFPAFALMTINGLFFLRRDRPGYFLSYMVALYFAMVFTRHLLQVKTVTPEPTTL